MWREAMMELLDQLEAENPEDPSLAPKVRRIQALLQRQMRVTFPHNRITLYSVKACRGSASNLISQQQQTYDAAGNVHVQLSMIVTPSLAGAVRVGVRLHQVPADIQKT